MGWFCRRIHAFILIFRDGDALIFISTFHLPGEFKDFNIIQVVGT